MKNATPNQVLSSCAAFAGLVVLVACSGVTTPSSTPPSTSPATVSTPETQNLPEHAVSISDVGYRSQIRAVVDASTDAEEMRSLAVELSNPHRSEASNFLVSFFSDREVLHEWDGTGLLTDSDWDSWLGRLTVDFDGGTFTTGEVRVVTEEERIEAAEIISDSEAKKADEAPAELRWHDFTDVSGQFQVKAQLAGFASGTATLRKEDGSEVKVSVDRLSEADQQWIREEIRQRSR